MTGGGPHHREPEKRGIDENRQSGRQTDGRDTANGIAGRRLNPVGVWPLASAGAANTSGKCLYIALPVAGNERYDRYFGFARREEQRLDDRTRFDTERCRRLFGTSGSSVKRDYTVRMSCHIETGRDMPYGRMG